jgi:SAM-dependent methyltransferase
LDERANQADVKGLWDEVTKLYAAIEARAAGDDVAKLWAEIPKLFASLDGRVDWSAMEEVSKRVQALQASLDDQVRGVWSGIGERDAQHELDFAAIKQLQDSTSRHAAELQETRARLLAIREQITWLESMSEIPSVPQPATVAASPAAASVDASFGPAADPAIKRRLDLAYLQFQRLYRGDEEELANRLARYIPILVEANGGQPPEHLLDVACGDGIFLGRLAAEGWSVEGVDINEAMTRLAGERGLKVEKGDAVAFLEAAEPDTFGAVTALQFVEHLPPEVLFRFLLGAWRSLKPGGLLLVETINPHTLKALHWFHLDLSHARLVFPEMLGLLCETAGFTGLEWKGINPVSEHERLVGLSDEAAQGNVDRLNRLLFGDQDYYLIARKPIR